MKIERWGPYCVLPRGPVYIEVVYPIGRGLILDDNGQVREMTAAELDDSRLMDAFERALRHSFVTSDTPLK